MSISPPRVFLLSPASLRGERARRVLSDRAEFDLAVRLRAGGASVGDVFQFISSLYFRGKAEYSRAFASPPMNVAPAVVIAAGLGLIEPEAIVTIDQLRDIAAVPIDTGEARYRTPLERDARRLNEAAGGECVFILLGSVATEKYAEPLLRVFGARLLFPADFVGRGDMSRGGLMLRSARAGTELMYTPVLGATVHGKRPPKLPKIR